MKRIICVHAIRNNSISSLILSFTGDFFTFLQNPAAVNIISLNPQILLSDDKSQSLLYCAILCHRIDSCAAFVFSEKQQLCTLYDSIVKSFKVTESAAVHYALLC